MATSAEMFDQALWYHQSGQSALAASLYLQIIHADPSHAEAHCNLGVVLKEQGRLAEAVACYRQALRYNPNFANAYNNLGNALVLQGKVADAMECFRQALRCDPNHANAHNNLGLALYGQNQFAEASACFQQALRINPNYAQAYDNLGTALVALRRLGEATDCYRQGLLINPREANAHVNLGKALAHQKLLDEAAECFQKALQIDPGHTLALWNRSLVRLSQGDFEGGWPGYEQRWARPGNVRQQFQQPRWDGSLLEGKTLLVSPEQGLGDTIQFVRYLPMVRQRGGKVILGCQNALVKLCTGIAGVDQIVPVGETLPPFDVQIPLLSLPGLFRTTLATIPADIPYLSADPKLIDHWRQVIWRAARRKPAGDIPQSREDYKIGIVWQGSMNQPGDSRSLLLKDFEPLARVAGVRLLSLQIGPGTQQLATATFPVTDLGSGFDPSSLDDLAAALMNLDLVVSVDTAVAHLAGALGRPVWTLLSFAPDWRWLLERSDNPWYPTMRLFRQSQLGVWGDVLERIAAEVRDEIATHRRSW